MQGRGCLIETIAGCDYTQRKGHGSRLASAGVTTCLNLQPRGSFPQCLLTSPAKFTLRDLGLLLPSPPSPHLLGCKSYVWTLSRAWASRVKGSPVSSVMGILVTWANAQCPTPRSALPLPHAALNQHSPPHTLHLRLGSLRFRAIRPDTRGGQSL